LRARIVAAYAVPGAAVWLLLGLCLTALPLADAALVAVAGYGGYYGVVELTGRRGLPAPGRSWQVPQTFVIAVPPWRRVLLWGAILGPGLATRNPYAGFGLLPLAVAAMSDPAAGLALGAAIGLTHGTARALALLRDVRDPGDAIGHLELLLKTVYWRRLDGCVLLIVAAAALVASVQHVT
jgi:hypothetical protein